RPKGWSRSIPPEGGRTFGGILAFGGEPLDAKGAFSRVHALPFRSKAGIPRSDSDVDHGNAENAEEGDRRKDTDDVVEGEQSPVHARAPWVLAGLSGACLAEHA